MILPDNVDVEAVQAKMENGVLTIEIPKKEEESNRKSVRQIDIR